MTVPTPTDPLAAALAAKAEGNGAAPAPPPADPVTGEIVPVVEAPPPPPAPTDFSYVPAKVVGGLPYAADYWKLAQRICNTELVPDAFRGRPDAVLAAFLRGYELGFGPMQALDSLNVIKGKVGLSAEAMRGLILGNGHQIIVEATNTEATAECHRADWAADKWAKVKWDLADAKRAQLPWAAGGGKYPRAMLSARVTSEAARLYFPDVIAGMSYTPEEIADFTDRPATAEPPRAHVPSPVETPASPSSATAAETGTPDPGGPAETAETAPAPEPAKRTRKAASAPAKAPERAPAAVGEAEDTKELVKALQAVINGLSRPQQQLVRGYLAQHGMGDLSKLTADQLTEACRIAAGWPTSVQVPEQAEAEADDAEAVEALGIVDAEVVEDPAAEEPEGFF
jgi:hypothetical protein